MINLLLVASGLLLLVAGGETLIRGSVAVARKLGLSRIFIGVVLLGFGTSMPEMVATFGSAAKGFGDIAFGNVLGSNIANILLILGLSALLFPIATDLRQFRTDVIFVSLSSLICLLLILSGALPTLGAIALLGLFGVYIWRALRSGQIETEPVPADASTVSFAKTRSLPISLGLAFLGIALLVIGADLLVRGASQTARSFGVPDAIIGLTVVGVGTSLPELTASITASLKRENQLAFANILGSNIFNIFAILGLSAAVFPLEFGASGGGFSWIDGLTLIGATLLMVLFATSQRRINRWEGAIMVLAYAVYLLYLFSRIS